MRTAIFKLRRIGEFYNNIGADYICDHIKGAGHMGKNPNKAAKTIVDQCVRNKVEAVRIVEKIDDDSLEDNEYPLGSGDTDRIRSLVQGLLPSGIILLTSEEVGQ